MCRPLLFIGLSPHISGHLLLYLCAPVYIVTKNMKLPQLLLAGIFLIATSFTINTAAPGRKNTEIARDSAREVKCGPAFDILNTSNGTLSSLVFSRDGVNLINTTSPSFPIHFDQMSLGYFVVHARISASSPAPMAVIVKDHYNGNILGCDLNQPGGLLHVEFGTSCLLYDIIFTNDLSLCGM
jgi:hypothetical protein